MSGKSPFFSPENGSSPTWGVFFFFLREVVVITMVRYPVTPFFFFAQKTAQALGAIDSVCLVSG